MAKFEKGLTLFEECLSVLGTWRVIALESEQDKIMHEFSERLPWVRWGRIDWEAVDKKYPITLISDISVALKKENKTGDEPIYILWDSSRPTSETTLDEALRNLEDVTAVSFDTWFYYPSEGWIVELWHHDGEIYLGFF